MTSIVFQNHKTRSGASAARFAAPLLFLACLSGCGADSAEVSGNVTKQGQPVGGASIVFANQSDANAPGYTGVAEPDGKYLLYPGDESGVKPGKYRVTVTWWTLRDGSPLPEGEEGASLRDSGQAVKHEVTFEKDVTPGANTIDLPVDQGKPPAR